MSDIEQLQEQVKAQRLQILMLIAMQKSKGMPYANAGSINRVLEDEPLPGSKISLADREGIRVLIRSFFPEVGI